VIFSKKPYALIAAIVLLQASLSIAVEGPAPMVIPDEASVQETKAPKKLDLNSPLTRDQLIGEAYKYQMDMMLPMTADHIRDQKRQVKNFIREVKAKELPTMSTGSVQLILEPNAPIPVVNVTPGYATALAFYDITGAPWPITSSTEGNAGYFNVIKPDGLDPGNLLTIESLKEYSSSNIILTLADFTLPVVIELKTTDLPGNGEKVKTNSVVSFRATKMGPLANKLKIGKPVLSPVSEELMSFLDGIPPKEAELVKSVSSHPAMDMWKYKGRLYLRTQLPLIWPAYDHIINGSEGITLYRLPLVANIMVADDEKSISYDVQ
jgi:intracellular multiplication protein IcmK